MRYAGEQHFGDSPGHFAQHGKDGASFRDTHVPAALLYGLDDLVGYRLAGDVDREPHPVGALEGRGRRFVVHSLGEHVGGDGNQPA